MDCTGITVIDRNKKPEPEKETPVTFPNGLNAKCRDAFLQFKAAEKNYDVALKSERDLGTTFGAAGQRGIELYKRAVADRKSASETKYQANLALEQCQAAAGGAASQGPTVKPPAPQERACDANEAAAFAKLAGSWKGWRVNVTIEGSCEQTSGKVTWAEYCEGIDAPYNQNLQKYTGTFTGRVQGGSLGVTWTQPAAGPHPKTTGTATCSIGSDGLLNCTGFGCAVGAKKQ
jgi:Flp pilus assembly protein TadG